VGTNYLVQLVVLPLSIGFQCNLNTVPRSQMLEVEVAKSHTRVKNALGAILIDAAERQDARRAHPSDPPLSSFLLFSSRSRSRPPLPERITLYGVASDASKRVWNIEVLTPIIRSSFLGSTHTSSLRAASTQVAAPVIYNGRNRKHGPYIRRYHKPRVADSTTISLGPFADCNHDPASKQDTDWW